MDAADIIYNIDDRLDQVAAGTIDPADRHFIRVEPGCSYSYYALGQHQQIKTQTDLLEVTSIVHERAGIKCHERCPGGICPNVESDEASPLLVGPKRFA